MARRFLALTLVMQGCSTLPPTEPDAAVDAGSDAGVVDAGLRPPFDWVGIIGTGQSLSVGTTAPPTTTTASFNNLKLDDLGAGEKFPSDGGGLWVAVPLREPIREGLLGYAGDNGGEYPSNIEGETPHTAMATQLTVLATKAGAADYVSVHSVVGWSARAMTYLNKQGGYRPYPSTLTEARAFRTLARAAHKTLGYAAVVLTHGETDNTNPSYGPSVVSLQRDYQTDLQAITGQTTPIPLLASQQSTLPSVTQPDGSQLGSSLALLKAGVDNPGKVIVTGPKYHLPYSPDFLHLTAAGYRALGEKTAEVIDALVNHGVPWRALQPLEVSRAGAVITVRFHVPNPPLAFESSLAPPHQSANLTWKNGRGFEVIDSTGPLTIASVALANDVVTVTLSAAPTGTGLRVRYAIVQDGAGLQGGNVAGLRGQLRDSDALVGADAQTFECMAATGSADVTCPTANFATRGVRDRVTGSGVAGGTVVSAISGSRVTLSAPIAGASGTVALTFAYDLRNYAVHFDLPVP